MLFAINFSYSHIIDKPLIPPNNKETDKICISWWNPEHHEVEQCLVPSIESMTPGPALLPIRVVTTPTTEVNNILNRILESSSIPISSLLIAVWPGQREANIYTVYNQTKPIRFLTHLYTLNKVCPIQDTVHWPNLWEKISQMQHVLEALAHKMENSPEQKAVEVIKSILSVFEHKLFPLNTYWGFGDQFKQKIVPRVLSMDFKGILDFIPGHKDKLEMAKQAYLSNPEHEAYYNSKLKDWVPWLEQQLQTIQEIILENQLDQQSSGQLFDKIFEKHEQRQRVAVFQLSNLDQRTSNKFIQEVCKGIKQLTKAESEQGKELDTAANSSSSSSGMFRHKDKRESWKDYLGQYTNPLAWDVNKSTGFRVSYKGTVSLDNQEITGLKELDIHNIPDNFKVKYIKIIWCTETNTAKFYYQPHEAQTPLPAADTTASSSSSSSTQNPNVPTLAEFEEIYKNASNANKLTIPHGVSDKLKIIPDPHKKGNLVVRQDVKTRGNNKIVPEFDAFLNTGVNCIRLERERIEDFVKAVLKAVPAHIASFSNITRTPQCNKAYFIKIVDNHGRIHIRMVVNDRIIE